MPLAKCPKCGAVFPNTLRECPRCGYSPFVRRSAAPPDPAAPVPPGTPGQEADAAAESIVMEDVVTEDGTVVPQAVLPQPFPPRNPPAPEAPPPEAEAKPQAKTEKKKPKLGAILLPLAAAAVLIAVAAIALPKRSAPSEPGSSHASAANTAPDPPAVCAEGEHEWTGATCTQPKTCARCGKTEGEPLGHNFVDNVCTRCGACEKLFTFSNLKCKRRGGELVFSGTVRNYSEYAAKKLELRLEFFDENKQLLFADTVYILEDETVQPQEASQWRLNYAEPGITWKYWRVSITNFVLG